MTATKALKALRRILYIAIAVGAVWYGLEAIKIVGGVFTAVAVALFLALILWLSLRVE